MLRAVLAVADGPFWAVQAVYVHDDRVTRNAGGWVQGMAGEKFGSGDLLRIQVREGLPTETHYGMLTPDFGAYWPTTARGDGILSIGIWAQHRSRESFVRHFPNGEPIVSIVDIPLVCDWRAGNDPDDPSTWGISYNPIVWMVHIETQRHGRSWARSVAPSRRKSAPWPSASSRRADRSASFWSCPPHRACWMRWTGG